MYKLIIVDDEREINVGFAQYFPWRDIGFEIVSQHVDARSALAYIEKNPVDVIVSDIVMPGMNGLDFSKAVSEMDLEPRPHVLIFSAHSKFEYAQRALQYKCTEYILKSAEYDELIDIFTRLKKTIDEERNVVMEITTFKVDLPEAAKNDQVIRKIVTYVKENLTLANLDAASELVYMSPAYVSHYFKTRCELTFTDYVLALRMHEAGELLLDAKLKIYEVSELVGYKNPTNFARMFRKYFNVSPKEYRYKHFGRSDFIDEEA